MKQSRFEAWGWLVIGAAFCIAGGIVALAATLGLSLMATNAMGLGALVVAPAAIRRIALVRREGITADAHSGVASPAR